MDSIKLLQRIHLWKNIQFACYVLFQIVFILLLICNNNFRYNIFSNKSLFLICLIMWISSLSGILFLIHDYTSMKQLVIEQHALSNIAYLDDLTGIPNRYSCDQFLKNFSNTNTFSDLGCGMITITNLKQVNANIDRQSGDAVIQDFSNILDEASTQYGFIGRNGGNEFIIIIEHCTDSSEMEAFFKLLLDKLSTYNNDSSNIAIEIQYTYVLNNIAHKKNLSELLTMVHQKLALSVTTI